MTRLTLACCAALAACAAPPTPPGPAGRADAARAAACHDNAELAYRQQNRGAIFTGTDQSASPYSANYTDGNTARGLGDRFAYQNSLDDCLRAAGAPIPPGR